MYTLGIVSDGVHFKRAHMPVLRLLNRDSRGHVQRPETPIEKRAPPAILLISHARASVLNATLSSLLAVPGVRKTNIFVSRPDPGHEQADVEVQEEELATQVLHAFALEHTRRPQSNKRYASAPGSGNFFSQVQKQV